MIKIKFRGQNDLSDIGYHNVKIVALKFKFKFNFWFIQAYTFCQRLYSFGHSENKCTSFFLGILTYSAIFSIRYFRFVQVIVNS